MRKNPTARERERAIVAGERAWLQSYAEDLWVKRLGEGRALRAYYEEFQLPYLPTWPRFEVQIPPRMRIDLRALAARGLITIDDSGLVRPATLDADPRPCSPG